MEESLVARGWEKKKKVKEVKARQQNKSHGGLFFFCANVDGWAFWRPFALLYLSLHYPNPEVHESVEHFSFGSSFLVYIYALAHHISKRYEKNKIPTRIFLTLFVPSLLLLLLLLMLLQWVKNFHLTWPKADMMEHKGKKKPKKSKGREGPLFIFSYLFSSLFRPIEHHLGGPMSVQGGGGEDRDDGGGGSWALDGSNRENERGQKDGQIGQDRTGHDRTGQDKTGQDRTGQFRSGQTDWLKNENRLVASTTNDAQAIFYLLFHHQQVNKCDYALSLSSLLSAFVQCVNQWLHNEKSVIWLDRPKFCFLFKTRNSSLCRATNVLPNPPRSCFRRTRIYPALACDAVNVPPEWMYAVFLFGFGLYVLFRWALDSGGRCQTWREGIFSAFLLLFILLLAMVCYHGLFLPLDVLRLTCCLCKYAQGMKSTNCKEKNTWPMERAHTLNSPVESSWIEGVPPMVLDSGWGSHNSVARLSRLISHRPALCLLDSSSASVALWRSIIITSSVKSLARHEIAQWTRLRSI